MIDFSLFEPHTLLSGLRFNGTNPVGNGVYDAIQGFFNSLYSLLFGK